MKKYSHYLAATVLTFTAVCSQAEIFGSMSKSTGSTQSSSCKQSQVQYSNLNRHIAGSTALQKAVSKRDYDMVQRLLDCGFDVNEKSDRQETALHFAASNGDLKMVKLLLEKGSLVDARDVMSWTPLVLAANKNMIDGKVVAERLEIITLLQDRGANINQISGLYGNNVLQAYSCEKGSKEVVEMLVKRGANPFISEPNLGVSAFIGTVMGSRLDYFCEGAENLPLFVSLGGDINETYHDFNILSASALINYVDGVNTAIRLGAHVNFTNKNGQTALHAAAKKGSIESIKTLVNNGSKLEIKDLDGNTALDIAAKNNQKEAVRVLISLGAKQ